MQDITARVGIRREVLVASLSNGHSNGGGEPSATSRAASVLPHSKAGVKDYLVGSQLDDALARGEDIVVSFPFADGDVKDFIQAEAIW
jgi:actin-related protein 9